MKLQVALWSSIVYSLFFIISCGSQTDSTFDFSALGVSWEVVGNHEHEDELPAQCHAAFYFTNHDTKDTLFADWELYFSQSPRLVKKIDGPATVEHISGDFYRFSPNEDWTLPPGDSIRVDYYVGAWLIKETDGPRGAYVISGDRTVPLPQLTIRPFVREKQTKRYKGDRKKMPTASNLYFEQQQLGFRPDPNLWNSVPKASKQARFRVYFPPEFENEFNYLQKSILKGFAKFERISNADSADIILGLGSKFDHSERYRLSIQGGKADVKGRTEKAVFYALQDLIRQFQWANEGGFLKDTLIEDYPRFSYRGIHLDVARNFQSIGTVKDLLDLLAFYKINILHLHLTDDEGWRLEIPGLPELTEVGAFRKHGSKESPHLHPSYGSGPFADEKTSYGSGYYTKEQFKEILSYAKDRHIKVIPEINFPGHARAAIKAMNAYRKKWLAQDSTQKAEQYWLIDPQDTSNYLSAQYYTDNVACVCREPIYDFYEKVLDEVVNMYKEAEAELDIVHTGGDEVPNGAWAGSPICQEFLKRHPEIEGVGDLTRYFYQRLAKLFSDKGLQLGGWEEIALKKDGSIDPNFLQDSFLCYVWNNLWGPQGPAHDLGNKLANTGYPVVLCNVTNLYFDLAYDKHPQEPGLYWGGFVGTWDAYAMMPYDVFSSILEDNMGAKFERSGYFAQQEVLKSSSRPNVKGIQAQLWSETIEGPAMLQHYILPKLLGFAEVAWNRDLEEDEGKPNAIELRRKRWAEFASSRMKHDLRMLSYAAYPYRVPPPGGFIIDGMLHVNLPYPGFGVLYYPDGNLDPQNGRFYEGPTNVSGKVALESFSPDGRKSRMVWVDLPK